jgi:hypothetical protein
MAKIQKIKMTKEYADQLMGLLPISAEARHRYIPREFLGGSLPPELIPVFVIRPMTKADKQVYSKSFDPKTTKSYESCIFDCIESVENLYDVISLEPVDFTLEYFMGIHTTVREKIASEVLRVSCLLPIEAMGLK